MQISSLGGVQFAGLDDSDSGEGLAIFCSQDGNAACRWRVLVKARIDQGLYDMGEFYISPPIVAAAPAGRLSRLVAIAVCPGAIGWSVEMSAVKGAEAIPYETADIILASSKCCMGSAGLERVSERYGYVSGTGTQNFTVLAGMKVTGIGAIGLTGGGSIVINGGNTILVPDGISANPEPRGPIPPNSVIAFTNVDYTVEFLESA